jgi:hypothetical protein
MEIKIRKGQRKEKNEWPYPLYLMGHALAVILWEEHSRRHGDLAPGIRLPIEGPGLFFICPFSLRYAFLVVLNPRS